MRIYINEKKGTKLWLALPACLVLNRFTAIAVIKGIKSQKGFENINLKSSDILKLFAEIKKAKKKYPGMELVDISTNVGDTIKIKL